MIEAVVIGCGPYGLAASAFLREAGVETKVFGEPMGFWRNQMPEGMNLRSAWYACNIADPANLFTLNAFLSSRRESLTIPVPRRTFLDYSEWFRSHWVPDLDQRRVLQITPNCESMHVQLADGEDIRARRVIVAAGIAQFANRPTQLAALPAALVSHSSDHKDLAIFKGNQVAVIGGGQSAIESAALLREAGAEVEVIMRAPRIRWLRGSAEFRLRMGRFRRLLYPPTDVGPPGLSQIVARPPLFRLLPARLRNSIAYRSVRPSAAPWLKDRLDGVKITTSCEVTSAVGDGDRLCINLTDGSYRVVDHVMLATGYSVDVSRYPFLSPQILSSLDCVGGYPRLNDGFESSVRGLHFLGAPSVASFGPLTRFVSGTEFTGRTLIDWIRRRNGRH